MGHISLQYGTYLYTVWDISLQYGTYLYTVWGIYLCSTGHNLITGWDTYLYRMGIYMHYVTVITVWDIYLYGTCISIQYGTSHLSIQDGTYIYSVWDIYLYSMGHISIVWGIYYM